MKKVIIFGCSGYGKQVLYSLDDSEYQVVAYIDNCKEVQNKIVNGLLVVAPSEVIKYEFDYVIISLPWYEEEMREQLGELGIANEKIITYKANKNGIVWDETRLAMLRASIEQIKERGILGNIAELGVYKGEFSKYLNRYFPERKLYLFDTFEGFEEKDSNNNDIILSTAHDFKDTCVDEVMAKMEYPDNVIIKKGYFPNTAENLEDQFAFVSIDADLYLPIFNGLEYFYPRLSKGGYIFVHDFGTYAWEGAKQAVYDFCEKYEISFVPILDRCLSIIITK